MQVVTILGLFTYISVTDSLICDVLYIYGYHIIVLTKNSRVSVTCFSMPSRGVSRAQLLVPCDLCVTQSEDTTPISHITDYAYTVYAYTV